MNLPFMNKFVQPIQQKKKQCTTRRESNRCEAGVLLHFFSSYRTPGSRKFGTATALMVEKIEILSFDVPTVRSLSQRHYDLETGVTFGNDLNKEWTEDDYQSWEQFETVDRDTLCDFLKKTYPSENRFTVIFWGETFEAIE